MGSRGGGREPGEEEHGGLPSGSDSRLPHSRDRGCRRTPAGRCHRAVRCEALKKRNTEAQRWEQTGLSRHCPCPLPSHCTAQGDPFLHRPLLPTQVLLKILWSFSHLYWCQTSNTPHPTLFQLLSCAAGLLSTLLHAVQLWLCSSIGGGVSLGKGVISPCYGHRQSLCDLLQGLQPWGNGESPGNWSEPWAWPCLL